MTISRSAVSPEMLFLAVGSLAGLVLLLITPPFKGADEPAHWLRTYQVAEGGIVAERQSDQVGGLLPRSLSQAVASASSRRDADDGSARASEVPRSLGSADRIFIDFRNTAVFTPVPYLPHAFAIGLARALRSPPMVLLYAGRLAGLAAALALGFFAIRITPIGKHVFLLLALTPMAIRQMSLITADSVTNGAALLLLAMFLQLALEPGAVSTGWSEARLMLCSIAVSLSKIAYVPLLLLYLLCPAEALGGRRRYATVFLVLIGVNVVVLLGWFWTIRDLYLPQRIAPDADPARQMAFILGHPLQYARVLVGDLHRNWETYLAQCTGFAGDVPHVLGWLYLGATFVVALFDCRQDVAIGSRGKVIMLLVGAAVYVMVNSLNYLGWNPVGSPTINFIQGRYYIPILPFAFLLVSNRRWSGIVAKRRLTIFSGCVIVLSACVAIRYGVRRWYGV